MSEELVLVDREDGVATVTLNRPDALNALSMAMRNRISEVFIQLEKDQSVQAIVLTGAGRAFTVGLDLKELGGEKKAVKAGEDVRDVFSKMSKPIIGAINGFAITGGFELALLCDFLIASPDARFADTHARVGVVPGWGLSQRLPRLIGINRAKELSLTGNYLDADTASAWGLVNRVVPVNELLPVCRQLALDIASTDQSTRNEIKRIMDAGWESTLADGLQMEIRANRTQGVATEKVAKRRADIQARGRNQAE